MSIKRKFASSSIWVVVGRGGSNLASFLIFALLAQFLGPKEFGLVAFAAVFVDLTRSLALAGVPQALVQRSKWDDAVASTAFWLNMAFAAVFVGVMCGLFAPLVGSLYNPQLTPIISTLSLTFLIDAARATHEAKAQREFGFRMLATRTMIATVVGGVVGVALAFNGFGAWALVMSRLVTSTIQTIVVWTLIRWTPRFDFSVNVIRSLLSFGMHLSGAAFIAQLNARAAEVVIGLFLGTTAVGFYRLGSRALNMLGDIVIVPMQATALSAFSRLRETGSVALGYLRLTKALSLLSFPVYFGAAVIAPDFVVVCFGAKWSTSGLVMSMLGIAGAPFTLGAFALPALAAAGKARYVLFSSLTSLATNVLVALVTVRYGVVFVALGFSLRAYLTVPLYLVLLRRGLGVPGKTLLAGLAPGFLSALAMAGVLVLVRTQLLWQLHPLPRLMIIVPLGFAIYAGCLLLFGRHLLLEMRDELRPILSGAKRRSSGGPQSSADE